MMGRTSASSAQSSFNARGAIDGDRFSTDAGAAWKGEAGAAGWWWQIAFDAPRDVGAILQIQGDLPERLENAPRSYIWQWSTDGAAWHDLSETATERERRTFRLHRLAKPVRAAALRLRIDACTGHYPALREVEIFATPDATVPFDDWAVVVSTLEEERWPGAGDGFITLARRTPGWEHLQFQHVWLASFDEAFIAAEPRPLCAFLSGNFKDWCEVPREAWRGAQEVLTNKNLPLWGACGGAQGLAILADTGVDREWDCPHCRDPRNPKLPIYTHIGHTHLPGCGDYSGCDAERGKYNMLQIRHDPAFDGVPRQFEIMESHCGQIAYPPVGWSLVVTAGEGAKTKTQCIRVNDRYIYAAQFHMEMEGTPENSVKIMSNFLSLAKSWGGYNPHGTLAPEPPEWSADL